MSFHIQWTCLATKWSKSELLRHFFKFTAWSYLSMPCHLLWSRRHTHKYSFLLCWHKRRCYGNPDRQHTRQYLQPIAKHGHSILNTHVGRRPSYLKFKNCFLTKARREDGQTSRNIRHYDVIKGRCGASCRLVLYGRSPVSSFVISYLLIQPTTKAKWLLNQRDNNSSNDTRRCWLDTIVNINKYLKKLLVYNQHLLLSFEELLSLWLSDPFTLVVGWINNNWLNNLTYQISPLWLNNWKMCVTCVLRHFASSLSFVNI